MPLAVIPTLTYANAIADSLVRQKAGMGNYSDAQVHQAVLDAIAAVAPLGLAALGPNRGLTVEAINIRGPRPAKGEACVRLMNSCLGRAGGGDVLITFLGESHISQTDIVRADHVIGQAGLGAATLPASLFIFERTLDGRGLGSAGLGGLVRAVREDDFTTIAGVGLHAVLVPPGPGGSTLGMRMGRDARSEVVAGYVAATLGGTPIPPAGAAEHIILIFGENHRNMFSKFMEKIIDGGVSRAGSWHRRYIDIQSTEGPYNQDKLFGHEFGHGRLRP
jgi:hypothetical protein